MMKKFAIFQLKQGSRRIVHVPGPNYIYLWYMVIDSSELRLDGCPGQSSLGSTASTQHRTARGQLARRELTAVREDSHLDFVNAF